MNAIKKTAMTFNSDLCNQSESHKMVFVALDKASSEQIRNPIVRFIILYPCHGPWFGVRIEFKFHCNKSHVRQTLYLIKVLFPFPISFQSVDPIFLSRFHDPIPFAFNGHVNFILVFPF